MRTLHALALAAVLCAGCQQINLADQYPCALDSDCEPSFVCDQQRCKPGRLCDALSVNGRCPAGYECIERICHLLDAGSSETGPDGGPIVCTPKTCAELGATCGTLDDGCGHALTCGTGCTGTQVCNPVTNACCTPKTGACAGVTCGGADDGCGGTVNCGTCSAPNTCGGAGLAGQCGCTAQTVCEPGWCGARPNGCGGTLDCGSACPGNQTCGGGGTPNVCGANAPLRNGWHWEVPSTGGNSLRAIWMTATGAAQQGWATGTAGELRQYANGVWTQMFGVIPDEGRAIWGSSANDVWIAGANRTLYHWGGTGSFQTAQVGAGDMFALTGTAQNDVWAAGAAGEIQHFTGTWAQVASGTDKTLSAIYALGNNVWAAGANGTVVARLAGGAFAPMSPGVTSALRAVWASGPSDLWIGGDGVLSHWNGAAWTAAVGIPAATSWTALAGTAVNDVWATGSAPGQAVLAHFDGAAWTIHSKFIANGHALRSASVQASSSAWFAGDDGALVRWDGTGFKGTWLGVPTAATAMFGSAVNDVWIGAYDPSDPGNEITWWDGREYHAVPFPFGPQRIAAAMSFSRTRALAGVNTTGLENRPEGHVLLWDGTRWADMKDQNGVTLPNATITAAWGSAINDLWVATTTAGKPGFLRLLNGAPSSFPAPAAFGSMWGANAADLYAVGGGALYHSSGGAFTLLDTKLSGAQLSAVHGLSATEVWVAGNVLARWNGVAWTQIAHPFGATARFTHVWVAGPNHVLVSGPQGWAEYDNGNWTTSALQGQQNELVWGAADNNDYFVAGGVAPWAGITHVNNTGSRWGVPRGYVDWQPHLTWGGALLNGGVIGAAGTFGAAWFDTWSPWFTTGNAEAFTTVWGTNWNDLYFGGSNGTIFHDPGNGFKAEVPATGAPIEAFWGPALAHSNDNGQTPATDVWAVSTGGCWRKQGVTWSGVASCSGVAVHGTSGDDVWVVAPGAAQHWTGTGWASAALPAGMTGAGIYTAGGANVWAVGNDAAGRGLIAKWDGAQWSTVFGPYRNSLKKIAGVGTKVVAAGKGALVSFDGATWTSNEDTDADFVGLTIAPAAGGGSIAAAISAAGVIVRPDVDLAQITRRAR